MTNAPLSGNVLGMPDGKPLHDMEKLGEALDTLADARRHVEMMEIATRHDPNEDAKAFAAVIYTTLTKLEEARSQLEDLWHYRKAPQA